LTVSPSFIVMQIEPTIMAPTQMFITSPKAGLRGTRVSNECARRLEVDAPGDGCD
jgi:hypothetical protein